MRGILIFAVLISTFTYISYLLWRRHTKRTAEVPAYLDSYWDAKNNRRRSVRLKVRFAVTCVVPERRGDIYHIFSKNISGEGICLQAPEILPEGTQLELTVNIPKEKPIPLKGEVVWVREAEKQSQQPERLFDTGIKFMKIDPKDSGRLKNFLSSALNEEIEK